MPSAKFRKSMVHAVQNLSEGIKSSRRNGTGNPDAPLTELQRQFCVHIVEDQMTQTAAARAAGYMSNPGVIGMDLMKHPKIIQEIARRRAEYAVASQISKKQVVDGFLEAINMAKQKADPIVMVAGWREVGKMLGYYEPTKSQVSISVNGQLVLEKMNTMSDEELLQMANADIIDVETKEIGNDYQPAEDPSSPDRSPSSSDPVHEDDPSPV